MTRNGIYLFFLLDNLRKTSRCRNIIVGGANAGMKQNGNSAKNSTPGTPLSMLILVKMIAIADVISISTRPKVFQMNVSRRA